MQKIKDTIYYSASDIVNFLECEHLTALDLINLETPLPQAEDDEEAIPFTSRDYLPRFIEFLYSRNRLNVAISRARCLAILVANPALMSIRCTTPEQMALVNTLCWVRDYSGDPVDHKGG